MRIAYIDKKFTPKSLDLIDTANKIIVDYQNQGFDLTLRQLYYQMVARDIIRNEQKEYKRIGSIINDARLAGLIDWTVIVDRTRSLRANSHWTTPRSILRSAADSYLEDMWKNQKWRPEVWIEKDALVGVIAGICSQYDVPYFSCRGYTSQSSMWQAGQLRIRNNFSDGQKTFIIHLGDHDPSGIDMTRDIADRLKMFAGREKFNITRVALNMDQVETYNPPPNPAKVTDSRSGQYISEFGRDSWELDALEPSVIVELIRENLLSKTNQKKWKETKGRISEHQKTLNLIADNYGDIKKYIKK
jgi:hypothetical protein